MIGVRDQVEIVLDDDDRRAAVGELPQHRQQGAHVERVQAHARLVEHEHRVGLVAVHLADELEALCLAPGERGGRLAEGEVPQPQLLQPRQPPMDARQIARERQRIADGAPQQAGQGDAAAQVSLRAGREAAAVAVRAHDVDVRQELDVQGDLSRAVAAGAGQRARVVGEVRGGQPVGAGLLRRGVGPAQPVHDTGIGGHRRADVLADRGRVDHLGGEALRRRQLPHMGRGCDGARPRMRLQGGHERLEQQGALARAGDPRQSCQPPEGEVEGEGADGVDRVGREMDAAEGEHLVAVRTGADDRRLRAAEEARQPGGGRLRQGGGGAVGDDRAALGPRPGTDLDQPVRLAEDLHVVIDEDHRVAVGEQIAHHPEQSLDIRRVQADGRLVQDVEHPGGAVADGARQLSALPLAGGQRGTGPVQREVAQPQVDQPVRHPTEGLHERRRHLVHLRGDGRRDVPHPRQGVLEGLRRGLRQVQLADTGCPGRRAEAAAAAVRARALAQEPAHPGQTLLGVRPPQLLGDGQPRVAEGEVELMHPLRGGDGDVLLLLGAVEHDLALLGGQLPPGNVGADPELAGDGGLDVEAEHLPRHDGAAVEGLRRVWDQRGVVDRADDAGALAARARPAGVEREVLGARRMHALTALRAGQRCLRRYIEGGRDTVPAGAAVRGEPGEHQPQHAHQLGRGAEGGADARHAGPLPQRQCRGDVLDGVHRRPRRLGHAAAGVGRQGLDVAA